MTQPVQPSQPIGYWLKKVDNLITEHVNKVQTDNGLSRMDWQVLNTLYEGGPVSQERVLDVMTTFVDTTGLDTILTHLTGRGWVESTERDHEGKAMFKLTDEGKHHHGIILATQKEFRQRMMQGISEEEYATVLSVLQRFVRNLEGDTVS